MGVGEGVPTEIWQPPFGPNGYAENAGYPQDGNGYGYRSLYGYGYGYGYGYENSNGGALPRVIDEDPTLAMMYLLSNTPDEVYKLV